MAKLSLMKACLLQYMYVSYNRLRSISSN